MGCLKWIFFLPVALGSTAATVFCCKIVAHPPPSDGPGLLLFMMGIPLFGLIALGCWSLLLAPSFSSGNTQ